MPGVEGINSSNGSGVQGSSEAGRGVAGISQSWQGVYGRSETQAGVVGESVGFDGIYGTSASKDASGVAGHNTGDGTGVFGGSNAGRGVAGISKSWQGVYGYSESQAGVVGESTSFDGIWGASHSADHAAVSGHNDAGGYAGYFEGKVTVTKDLIVGGDVVIPNADAAEDFGVAAEVAPGTVMVVDSVDQLTSCSHAYDTRVVGVISGAGPYRPGIILDRNGSRRSGRQPAAPNERQGRALHPHPARRVGLRLVLPRHRHPGCQSAGLRRPLQSIPTALVARGPAADESGSRQQPDGEEHLVGRGLSRTPPLGPMPRPRDDGRQDGAQGKEQFNGDRRRCIPAA